MWGRCLRGGAGGRVPQTPDQTLTLTRLSAASGRHAATAQPAADPATAGGWGRG